MDRKAELIAMLDQLIEDAEKLNVILDEWGNILEKHHANRNAN